jgi:hypothetical protein
MSTTTLFVELLIIGLEVCLWLILGLMVIVDDSSWLSHLAGKFSGNAVLSTIVVFAVAYLVGIVIDKIAHFLIGYERLLWLLRPEHFESGSLGQRYARRLSAWLAADDIEDRDHPRMIHAQIMSQSGELGGDILYARSKIRILRASVINVPLIALFAAYAAWELCDSYGLVVLVLTTGTIFAGFVIFTYLYTQRLYNRRLRRFKRFLDR